jgi:hypothetical protein
MFIEFKKLITMLATQCHIPEYVIPQNKGSVLDLAAEGHTFSVIIHLILNLSLKQVHILFQSDFFTECDLVIPLSTSSTISSDEVFRICLFFWKNTIRRSNNVKVFRSVRRIAKSDYKLRHVRPSVLMERGHTLHMGALEILNKQVQYMSTVLGETRYRKYPHNAAEKCS